MNTRALAMLLNRSAGSALFSCGDGLTLPYCQNIANIARNVDIVTGFSDTTHVGEISRAFFVL